MCLIGQRLVHMCLIDQRLVHMCHTIQEINSYVSDSSDTNSYVSHDPRDQFICVTQFERLIHTCLSIQTLIHKCHTIREISWCVSHDSRDQFMCVTRFVGHILQIRIPSIQNMKKPLFLNEFFESWHTYDSSGLFYIFTFWKCRIWNSISFKKKKRYRERYSAIHMGRLQLVFKRDLFLLKEMLFHLFRIWKSISF